MARLPTVGGDDGNWGTLLNQFLQVAHNSDGSLKNLFFNVKDYGAVGNGSTDDTVAFQSAITAAAAVGGTVFIPASSSGYSITDTLNIIPASGAQVTMNILAEGKAGALILYKGANDKAIFKSYGWKLSEVHGVKIQLSSNQSGIIAWEMDTDNTRNSTTDISFFNCYVAFGTGTGCVGWRAGYTQDGDFSFLFWTNCRVRATNTTAAAVGWQTLRPNCLGWQFFGCSGVYLGKFFTNVNNLPSATQNGGGSMHFYGCNTSNTLVDFEFTNQGTYLINGGRFEDGKRFLDAGVAGGSFTMVVNVQAVTLAGYRPTDSIVCNISTAANVTFDGISMYDANDTSSYGSNTFRATAGKGSLTVRNSAIQSSGTFYSASNPEFLIYTLNNHQRGLSGAMTIAISDHLPAIYNKVRSLRPIAFWRMEETSGTALSDSSGNSRNGTATSGVLGFTGVSGRGALLTGSSTTINVFSSGLASAFTPNLFTISMWARTTTWSDSLNSRLLHFQTDASNRIIILRESGTTGELRATYITSGGTTTVYATGMTTLDWFHIAVVVDGTNNLMAIYINGLKVESKTLAAAWSSAIASANLGSVAAGTANNWFGGIDEVAIFDKALTDDDIFAIYKSL